MEKYKLKGTESLGIEFGSTRIKAVLIDQKCTVLAQGSHNWENEFRDGYWTYSLESVKEGLQCCFKDLNECCLRTFGEKIRSLGSIGISGMMHGYLPFDKNDNLLVPFRTWRNTTTAEAAEKLTEEFGFNIPQRWSIAHLYQAFLNKEEHIKDVAHINTLAGYVHYLLSGRRIIGIGEASGMFPIDSSILSYDESMIKRFDELAVSSGLCIERLLPEISLAGDNAGFLTKEGAKLLDPSGKLEAGAMMCPPEGDAGTGMVATNSILPRTGNVSAGTSIFSMIVLDKPINEVNSEIDIVSTPDGKDVAMIHCNNCCTDIDKWVGLFNDFLLSLGIKKDLDELYDRLYASALIGDGDCGGIVDVGLYSGEPVAHLDDAKPLLVREKDASFSFSNLARSVINSAFSTLKIGHLILENAGVEIDYLNGHGGLFKSGKAGQKLMADALGTEIRVSKTAGEGGAWGMAVLAEYALNGNGVKLSDYLDSVVFKDNEKVCESPDKEGSEGFEKYHGRFCDTLDMMRRKYNV